MKVIIAGSRDIYDVVSADRLDGILHLKFNNTLASWWIEFNGNLVKISEFVTGCASGVDQTPFILEKDAIKSGYYPEFAITKFPADWNLHGRAAGPIRNKQMAEYADILILVWDGKSKGSASMKKEMKKLKKPVIEVLL